MVFSGPDRAIEFWKGLFLFGLQQAEQYINCLIQNVLWGVFYKSRFPGEYVQRFDLFAHNYTGGFGSIIQGLSLIHI